MNEIGCIDMHSFEQFIMRLFLMGVLSDSHRHNFNTSIVSLSFGDFFFFSASLKPVCTGGIIVRKLR